MLTLVDLICHHGLFIMHGQDDVLHYVIPFDVNGPFGRVINGNGLEKEVK